MRKRTSNGLPEDEAALFRDAVRDATPLESSARVGSKTESPPPVPIQSLLDGHDALVESLAGALSWDQSMETGEEPSYLRTGLARDVLRQAEARALGRAGHCRFARAEPASSPVVAGEFLGGCLKRGLRCVRVVHGKGLRSPGREPVLKGKHSSGWRSATMSSPSARPEKSGWKRSVLGAAESLGLRQVARFFPWILL